MTFPPFDIIILTDQMSAGAFKNLLNGSMTTDDSCQPLQRKIDEYRRGACSCGEQLAQMTRHMETSEASLGRLVGQWADWGEGGEQGFYGEYVQLFRNMHGEQRVMRETVGRELAVFMAHTNSSFGKYNETIAGMQAQLRSYSANEQILLQLSKKYFRTHKNMLSQIEAYKDSFTDVKLIYNTQQKTKRYTACEASYQALADQLTTIEAKMKELSQKKEAIADAYKAVVQQMAPTVKSVAQQAICFTKKTVAAYVHMLKITITYQAEKKFTLQKLQLHSFLHESPECQTLRCPKFMVEDNLSQDELLRAIAQWAREVEEVAERRKKISRKMYEFTENFIKLFDKCWQTGLKELTSSYQKIKKRLGELFGNRFCSFLKSIHSIFEVTIGINQKMLKELPARLKSLQLAVTEEASITDLCVKEVSSALSQIKKRPIQSTKSLNLEASDLSVSDNGSWRKKVRQKGEYLVHIVEGFGNKLQKKGGEIKESYGNVLKDISVATNELYSLCCDYEELYFGAEDYEGNCAKFEADISKTLAKEETYYESGIFVGLLEEKQPQITFQSEISKVQQFKKLKKPTDIQIENEAQEKQTNEEKKKSPRTSTQVEGTDAIVQPKEEELDPAKNKEKEFLLSKITFLAGEEYIQSFSCAMSDKVLLQGRLYITNKRLCFHSMFNPHNLFFGATFIQIPKKDIQKIEKRVNAIVFDNSISLTTVNGEVFLTSFMYRNAAYDSIMNNLDIGNQQEVMFEEEEEEVKGQEQQQEQVPLVEVQEDDLKEEDEAARAAEIDKLLAKWPYKVVYKGEATFDGLTALQVLKIIETGPYKMGRKEYESFVHLHRQIMEHRNVQASEWKPHIEDYLNPNNLKTTTPLRFQRTIDCIVPVANSGVPFMPKQAKSHEDITLYIYSRRKYVMESVIQNSGVPYSDSFNIRIQRVVENTSQNTCTLTFNLHINFITTPMIKSIIESKGFEETKTGLLKLNQELNKYLAYLTKQRQLKLKASKKKEQGGAEATQNGNTEAVEELERQVKELRESEGALQKELKQKSGQLEVGRKALIASVVLNILLIMILIR